MENRAVVNKIIPFSNVDGPGNRLAIFFQGCNIKCVYCHNPETINECKLCMKCVSNCKSGAIKQLENKIVFDEKICVECDECIKTCSNNSSPRTEELSVADILGVIKDYRLFIRGITVSGGEPTLRAEFITELFKEVKKLNLTCFVDTNGFFDRDKIHVLIDETDKFMVDIKAANKIKELCSTDRNNNFDNLEYLLKLDKVYEVRTVLIKEYMDMETTVAAVSRILKDYPEVIYKLIRVHSAGFKAEQKEKIERNIPSKEEVIMLYEMAKSYGVKHVEIIM